LLPTSIRVATRQGSIDDSDLADIPFSPGGDLAGAGSVRLIVTT
jgi:hypothetical protein